jgi:ubiquinone/menaquinone biosynthesis C-methylase UbiE
MTVKLESASYLAPCLETGPLMHSGRAAVAAAEALGTSASATATRARCVPLVFDGMERVFASNQNPAPALCALLDEVTAICTSAAAGTPSRPEATSQRLDRDRGDLADITGEHYGRLFREFSSPSFWDEPVRLLRERLERNDVSPASWEGANVLDAGCGGGRYTVAWRLLKAASVVGFDVSPTGVANARDRVREAGIDGVTFETGDVLKMPYDDRTFDVAFSNGVLHHTRDWRTGIVELVRVLKSGGLGWLYLIESPGGFFWDLIEVLRVIMRDDDRDLSRRALEADHLPANRIFYMLDHVMVPINVRLTPQEVEDALSAAGATSIRRLTRGADFDRVEAIHRGDPFATDKYGVGENRYVFSKA